LSLPSEESPCYPIREIKLIDYPADPDTTALSRFHSALYRAVKSLNLRLPHCFGAEGVGILMKQVQNNIIEKGYVTTRVVAEGQNLQSGRLVLTVIEGRIGNTIIEDGSAIPRFTRLQAFTGLAFKKGDLLNIRDIEQSLENFKRLPTVEANIEILPSENTDNIAESDIKIRYSQGFPFRLNLGLDDSGSRLTGKYQGSAAISADNLFLANDLFYTSLTHSIKTGEDEKGHRASKNLILSYSIPFGYWTLSLTQTYNRYSQEVFGAFQRSYRYAGKSNGTKAALSYLLYRDNQRKTTLSGGFWLRQSQNFIDGAGIDVQKRRMAGWEAGIAHKEYLGDGVLEIEGRFKQGTGARGAISAPEELYGEGTSRPKIISASVSFTQPFMLGAQPWQWKTDWSAQWNKTPLIMQDRFSLGGRHTVRGFDGELTLSGERGWLWRNEAGWNINGKGQMLYWAIDAGRVSSVNENAIGRSLVGAAIGLKGGWKGFYYDIFVGQPIRKPTGFKTSHTTAGFQLGYSF
ncbi:ShlB/FhaC/HecB family hemolysin secretion/activation protein, partial [Caviibacterium pharyngocola]